MAQNVRRLTCPPEAVFDVLADGWLYPVWVVGAMRMRDVDHRWPEPGARLHHSVGIWPIYLDDVTEAREWDPPRRAVFRAKGWPIGEAVVAIEAKPADGGCLVRIFEEAVEGPARFVPSFIRRPVLHVRNSETLRRLGYLAEGRWEGK
jgi:hypothetical protein